MTQQLPAPSARDRREPGEVFGNGFSLFADVLLVGLFTSVACLPVVTAPAAFAAASATLRPTTGYGPAVRATAYLAHLRAYLSAGSLAGGLLPPVLGVILLIDVGLLDSALPGAHAVAVALVLLVLGAAAVALRSTALEAPHRLSVREGLLRSVADPRGTLLLAGGALLAGLLAWSIPLLVPLLPGALAFAATVVDIRDGRGGGDVRDGSGGGEVRAGRDDGDVRDGNAIRDGSGGSGETHDMRDSSARAGARGARPDSRDQRDVSHGGSLPDRRDLSHRGDVSHGGAVPDRRDLSHRGDVPHGGAVPDLRDGSDPCDPRDLRDGSDRRSPAHRASAR